MITNLEIKKQEALKRFEILEQKGLGKNYRKEFEKNNEIYLFERVNKRFPAVAYGVKMNSHYKKYDDLLEAINEFQEKYNALVYTVQLTHFEEGDGYIFFYVSDSPEEYELDNEDLKDGYAYCYCWNVGDYFSEIGSIGFEVNKTMGGIVRTA